MHRGFGVFAFAIGLISAAGPVQAGTQAVPPTEWTLHGTIELDGADRSLSVEKEYSTKSDCVSEVDSVHETVRNAAGSDQYRFEWHCENNTDSGEPDASGTHTAPTATAPVRPAARPRSSVGVGAGSIQIQCEGFDKLARSDTSFVLNIDVARGTFSGQERAMRDISGEDSVRDGLILLLYSNSVGDMTVYIDRNAGTFKVDRSTKSGLYLMDNITGSCRPFTGPRF